MFNLILADPPWQYRNWGAKEGATHERARGASKHYPTLSLEAIKRLPIAHLCNPNAALFLWVTWPLIQEGLEVIKAWGFEYKTLAWEWVKTSVSDGRPVMGMGSYTRSNPEPCLLAFRGKGIKVASHSEIALIQAPRLAHSRKPEEQYHKIDRLYPDLKPRLEVFATEDREGWYSWGNELAEIAEYSVLKVLGRPEHFDRGD